MRTLRSVAKLLAIPLLLIILFIAGNKAADYYQSYQDKKSLSKSVLGIALTAAEAERVDELKNGEILSKHKIRLEEIKPLWRRLSNDGRLKAEFAHLDEIDFYSITYKSDSGFVNGIIAEPKREGRFPVVVYNRGGNKAVGKIGRFKTLYSLILTASGLAWEGYVILAPCYRANDEFGGRDINDVLNIIKTSHQLPKAQSHRIGMLGWSRGGMMTYLALKNSREIKTAVVGNGPSDLAQIISDRPEMEKEVYARLIPDYKTNKKEELQKRSVIYWVDELDKNSSLLILCGSEDKMVNPGQAYLIAEKLEAINYNFSLREFKTDHKFSDIPQALNETLISWFNEKL